MPYMPVRLCAAIDLSGPFLLSHIETPLKLNSNCTQDATVEPKLWATQEHPITRIFRIHIKTGCRHKMQICRNFLQTSEKRIWESDRPVWVAFSESAQKTAQETLRRNFCPFHAPTNAGNCSLRPRFGGLNATGQVRRARF